MTSSFRNNLFLSCILGTLPSFVISLIDENPTAIKNFTAAWAKAWPEVEVITVRAFRHNIRGLGIGFAEIIALERAYDMNAELALFFEDDARPFVLQTNISGLFCRMIENWDVNSPILFLGGHSIRADEPPNLATGVTSIHRLFGAYGMAVRKPFFLKLSKLLRDYLLASGAKKSSPDVILSSFSYLNISEHHSGLATPMIVDHKGNHYSFTKHRFRKTEKWEGDPQWWNHGNHPKHQDASRLTVMFKDKHFKLCHYERNQNFGDNLGPAIVESLLKMFFDVKDVQLPIYNFATSKNLRTKKQVCLLHLGSVIHFASPVDHIWGSGILYEDREVKSVPPTNQIYAVRGMLTAAKIKKGWRPDALGDPARLIRLIGLSNEEYCGSSCAYEICFVPHMKDANVYQPAIGGVVHVFWPNTTWTNMIENLSNCRFVICSSLHCMIVSDALGIPNRWVQFKGSNTEKIAGLFKFQDYLSSISRINYPPARSLEQAIVLGPYRRQDNFNATALLASFPYHLFHVTKRL